MVDLGEILKNTNNKVPALMELVDYKRRQLLIKNILNISQYDNM